MSYQAPEWLAQLPVWLCWREESAPDRDKPLKVPYYSGGKVKRHGVLDTPEDRARLVTFDKLQVPDGFQPAYALGRIDDDLTLTGIDFDDVALDDVILPHVGAVLARANGLMIERSVSGEGFHLVGLTSNPPSTVKQPMIDGGGLEVYSGGRFFATGTVEAPGDGHPVEDWSTYLPPTKSRHSPATQAGEAPVKVGEGARNDHLWQRRLMLARAGLPEELVLDALREINEQECDPPLPDDEVEDLLARKGAVKKVPALQTAYQMFDVVDVPPAEDGAQAVDPLLLDLDTVATSDGVDKEFVIERWLPDDTVTLFAAHGGTGKSYLSLLIAIHVALGLPLFGCAVRRCRVLVYSAEDDITVMTARVKRYCVKYNIDPALLKGWLFIYDATESDNVLFTDGKAANHRTTDRYEWLKAKVEEHGAGLLILDNASDAYDASEIERAKVRQFITVLKRIAPATLLLAHVDAVSSMAKMEDAKGYSGSTGWHNSVRSRWFMAADGEDIVLSLPKANYAAQGAQVVIRWNPLELLFEPLTTRDGAPKAADHADDLLRLFASVCDVKDISPAKRTDASVYGTLKALEGFPSGLTPAEVHNQVTRWIAQGLVTPVSVTKPNRTKKEVLRLTDKGRERLAEAGASE